MRFAFIAQHRNIWPVAWLCAALDVSRSGFHAWLKRSPSARSRQDRAFEAAAPNRKWVADFTCIWTAEDWLSVAAVIDLFSRRVVGWAMKTEMTARLVADALMMAIWRRGKPDSLLHHVDQGGLEEGPGRYDRR